MEQDPVALNLMTATDFVAPYLGPQVVYTPEEFLDNFRKIAKEQDLWLKDHRI